MPILQVYSLKQNESFNIHAILSELAIATAKNMKIPTFAVRALWHDIVPQYYAQGGYSCTNSAQPSDTHGPLVNLTIYEGRNNQEIAKTMKTIAIILANKLSIKKRNICVVVNEVRHSSVLDQDTIAGSGVSTC